MNYNNNYSLICHNVPDGITTVQGGYRTFGGGWMPVGGAPYISPRYKGTTPHGERLPQGGSKTK